MFIARSNCQGPGARHGGQGPQSGIIQNSDLIINHGGISATLLTSNREALLALSDLQTRLQQCVSAGALDEETARAASDELANASRALTARGSQAATPALERARLILGTAAAAAPLLDAITNIVALVQVGGGN